MIFILYKGYNLFIKQDIIIYNNYLKKYIYIIIKTKLLLLLFLYY